MKAHHFIFLLIDIFEDVNMYTCKWERFPVYMNYHRCARRKWLYFYAHWGDERRLPMAFLNVDTLQSGNCSFVYDNANPLRLMDDLGNWRLFRHVRNECSPHTIRTALWSLVYKSKVYVLRLCRLQSRERYFWIPLNFPFYIRLVLEKLFCFTVSPNYPGGF